jgi:hypothetical protein
MLVLDGNIPRFPWEPSTTMLTYRLERTTEAFGVIPDRTSSFCQPHGVTTQAAAATSEPCTKSSLDTASQKALRC